ncbi:hypothetical protein DSO57_1020820 [Entomophthora muscae]|uniref:Uncharacterized protein n=1 Tax=Entomophthora muscae TaxID=34485 RepID=A0ACC2SSK2_9FUNG|nr:hypothetical protein DSO57_1020820 [Entomophthora muscae]
MGFDRYTAKYKMNLRQTDNFLEDLTILKEFSESLTENSPELLKQMSDSKLRMLTYNVNGTRPSRAKEMIQYLIKDGADIIGLQERLLGGRLIKAEIRYDEQFTFTASCVYAPCSPEENYEYWKKVRRMKLEGLFIFFGDVNTVIIPLYDVFGGSKAPQNSTELYKAALAKHDLQDALVTSLNSCKNMTRIIKNQASRAKRVYAWTCLKSVESFYAFFPA